MSNILKRIVFVVLIGVISIGFVGCGSPEKLQQVKKIAILDFGFDRNMPKVDKSGKESSSFNLMSVAAKAVVQSMGDIKETEIDFFNDIETSLIGLFENYGFDILEINSFKDNANYIALKPDEASGRLGVLKEKAENMKKAFGGGIYRRDGYQDIVLSPTFGKQKAKGGKEAAIKMCKELNVDAVATFDVQFVKIQEKIALVASAERLGAKGFFIVRDAAGELIFNKSFFVKAKDKQFKFSASGFEYTMNSAQSFDQIRDSLIAMVDKNLNKALTKK